MKASKLAKIQREMRDLKRAPQKARVLESLAFSLGRRIDNRGKEPTWVSDQFPALRPLSIPHHGGKDLSKGVLKSVLESLEEDVAAWEEWLEDQEEDDEESD